MVATILPASCTSRTRRSASGSRRILSGAQPPGAMIPASPDAGKSATRPSTLHGYPCLPRYSGSPRPASFTSKPASSRRSFGYQTSRSSYSGPTSIRIAPGIAVQSAPWTSMSSEPDAPPVCTVAASAGGRLVPDGVEHTHVQAGEMRLHVAAMGPRDGPLVVLLHGFPECWAAWRHQLPALAAAGFRAIAPDLRGYGGSGQPPRGSPPC